MGLGDAKFSPVDDHAVAIHPALLHSAGGRIVRRWRFALVESGGRVPLLPWPMEYTQAKGHTAGEGSPNIVGGG